MAKEAASLQQTGEEIQDNQAAKEFYNISVFSKGTE